MIADKPAPHYRERRAFLKSTGLLLTACAMPMRAHTGPLMLQPESMQSDILLMRRAY